MQISWDEWAVPSITGDDDSEVVFGIGYAQAVLHAAQVLELYGVARGTAASLWGSAFVKEDSFTITMGLQAVTDHWFATQAPETRTRLEAFCDGFNRACEEDPTRGAARREALPVTPRDVVAHAVRNFTRFNQIDPNQLAFSAADFYGVELPALAGSNAWAVSGKKSATGNAMVMINPHLAYILPYHRFVELRTVSPGRDFHGITLLGMPWQAMGYSDVVGWAHTVNPIRNLSVYELDLDDRGAYAWDGARRALEVSEHLIEVRDAEPVSVLHRRSVHGPVVTAPDGAQVAVRISGVLDHPATSALESWWQMSKASSVHELLEIHDRLPLPMFTLIGADAGGSIAALFCGTPWKRSRGDLDDSQRRLPGDDPSWLFDEVHPASAMPRVVDPESGWVQNCNETPWHFTSPALSESDYPAAIAPHAHQTSDLRFRISHRFLEEHPTVSPEELLELKMAKRAVLADLVLDQLLEAAEGDDALIEACRVLEKWDRQAGSDSPGYPLFWLWSLMSAKSFADPAFFVPGERPNSLPRGLADPQAGTEVLRGAVALFAALGLPLDARMGDLVQFGTDDDGALLPANGGAQAVGALKCLEVLPLPTGLAAVLGDTWVSRVELRKDSPAISDSLLVYGNATEPSAPQALSQYPLWAADQLRPRT